MTSDRIYGVLGGILITPTAHQHIRIGQRALADAYVVRHVVATNDSAQAQALQQVMAELFGQIASKTSVTDLETAAVNQSLALAQAICDVQATFDQALQIKADVLDVGKSVADAHSASARDLASVKAELQENFDSNASTDDLHQALVTEQNARASDYSSLSGSLGSQSGQLEYLRDMVITPTCGAVSEFNVTGHIMKKHEPDDETTGEIVFYVRPLYVTASEWHCFHQRW